MIKVFIFLNCLIIILHIFYYALLVHINLSIFIYYKRILSNKNMRDSELTSLPQNKR